MSVGDFLLMFGVFVVLVIIAVPCVISYENSTNRESRAGTAWDREEMRMRMLAEDALVEERLRVMASLASEERGIENINANERRRRHREILDKYPRQW